MADERIVETSTQPHTTVIERRGGGGGLLIGLALILAVVIGGFFLLNQSRNDNLKTNAITSAAKDVGNGAKKVGDAADRAVQ